MIYNANEIKYVNCIEELKNCLEPEHRIFIYGAGKTGVLVYLLLKQRCVIPCAFLVTDKPRYHKLESIPVIQYKQEKLKQDDIIIVAAMGNSQKEIFENCSDNSRKIIITKYFYEFYIDVYLNQVVNILDAEIENTRIRELQIYKRAEKERNILGDDFCDLEINNIDMEKRFLCLIRNMDAESKDILIKCLIRIKMIKTSNKNDFDIFTYDEKRKLLEADSFFKDKIIQLSENIWFFNGYFLPLNDFRAEIFYDKLGLECVKNIKCCYDKEIIDVGGYIGDSALILTEITKRNVHVFEPIKQSADMAVETGKWNQVKMKVINKAISDKEGVVSFSVSDSIYTSGLKKIGNRKYKSEIDVVTTTIDNYVEDNNLNIGLIKIHAEGNEQNVLKGAENTIKSQSPVIIVEINHTESDFFDIKPLIEGMNNKYKFTAFKPTNGFVCLGIKLIAEVL